MNYKPVVARNQYNGNEGTKAYDDAGKARMEREYLAKITYCYHYGLLIHLIPKNQRVLMMMDSNLQVMMERRVNYVRVNINNELPFDLEMPALEDISTFNFLSDHEDDDEMADMNNLDTTIQVSPTLTKRIYKDHPLDQVIVKNASTPVETQKPLLKDEYGEELDVHMYRSMIGSLIYLTSSSPDIMFIVCTCARYQVNPNVSHLHVVKMIFRGNSSTRQREHFFTSSGKIVLAVGTILHYQWELLLAVGTFFKQWELLLAVGTHH
nr:hypothetical protein [Tanacetum cinerariifolium]